MAFFVSGLLVCALFPELLVCHNEILTATHDTEIPFENTFSLVSRFYHGGIQLWDRDDQMNDAYFHLTGGMYTLINLLTAAVYLLLAPLFRHPGETFFAVYSSVQFLSAAFVRTLGGYLLLHRFSARPRVIFWGLVLMNAFVFQHNGFLVNNLYSYFPLVMYLLLCFFETFKLVDLLLLALVMGVAVANSPLFALGYFYQVMHLVIVAGILWAWWTKGELFVGQGRALFKEVVSARGAVKISVVLGICGFMVLPDVLLMKSMMSDFFVAHSGLGGTEGRLNNIFSAAKYFGMTGRSFAPPKDFLRLAFDFRDNLSGGSWMFLGAGIFLLAVLGLILSKHRQKAVLFWAIIFLIGLNVVPNPFAASSLVHWVNALSNPFQFLVRSFHMPALLMPYLIFPLAVLGLTVIGDLVEGRKDEVHVRRIPLAMGMVGIAAVYFSRTFPFPVKIYCLAAVGMVLILLVVAGWQKMFSGRAVIGRKTLTTVALIIVIALAWSDVKALSVYLRGNGSEGMITARHYQGLDASLPQVIDYQNPQILPFREFYRTGEWSPRFYSRQSNHGLFYHYTPLDRYFRVADIYEPRHITYKDFFDDPDIRRYLERDKRLIVLADVAMPSTAVAWGEILDNNLDRKVILIDGPAEGLPRVIPTRDQLTSDRISPQEPPRRNMLFSFRFSEARPHRTFDQVEYIFKLPKDFPLYVATTVFTDDAREITLTIGGRTLKPAQGKLVVPWTYDLQNVETGKLAILLPAGFDVSRETAQLKLSMSPEILDVWRNEFDRLGLTYRAPHDGWIVFHYPYDKKWRLSVDGRTVALHRVNRYFLGAPLGRGEHRILLEYWPGTPLRPLIFLSMILTTGVFFAVAGWCIRRETLAPSSP